MVSVTLYNYDTGYGYTRVMTPKDANALITSLDGQNPPTHYDPVHRCTENDGPCRCRIHITVRDIIQ